MHILPLARCTPELSDEVGGKAHGLGELLRAGFPVPPGFVLTTTAYRTSVAPIAAAIQAELAAEQPHRQMEARIAALFDSLVLSPDLAAAIDAAYAELCGAVQDLPVAVRSSATAEDSAEASFAGQQETYLWVCGADSVKRHVVRCWASLFGARAIEYRQRLQVPAADLAMAVVIQQMVPAEAAGVMMTLDPVSGDRSRIYIESAFGLGEIVVRGEVDPDRFSVDKATLVLSSEEIGVKQRAYRFSEAENAVTCVELPAMEQPRPSLAADEVIALATLGRRIETHFGRPMDVEWAIATDPVTKKRELFMLQARPETVWSNRPEAEPEDLYPGEEDPLHGWSEPHEYWSTSNIGEALPGVQTPLSASIWQPLNEDCMREFGYQLGYLTAEERKTPSDIRERFHMFFYGRAAGSVKCVAVMGDRVPGMTGPMAVAGLFGRVPEDMVFHPTTRYHNRVWRGILRAYLTLPSRLKKLVPRVDAWWRESAHRAESLDRREATALFREAVQHFYDALLLQYLAAMGLVQPSLAALDRIARHTGTPDVNQLSAATGNQEMAVVCDLWAASRGRMTVEELVARHGFHGPMEGEVSTRVWREDPTPLRRMVEHYAQLDADSDPRRGDEKRAVAQAAIVDKALAAVPAWQRPLVRFALKLARQHLPLRGVAKCSFMQAFDVTRACARRLGDLLATEGLIERADDVFYLTMKELTGELPANIKLLIAARRRQRAAYQQLSIPSDWKGMPPTQPLDAATDDGDADQVHGLGVSRGVVEGRVRVVLDPDFSEIEPGEVLVAPTTDPSWSSIIFVSAAIVVDIGGALSHAAVVAREMNIPCVVNTRSGTRALRTGDFVRVDGTTGIVHVLQRAGEVSCTVDIAGPETEVNLPTQGRPRIRHAPG